MTTNPTVGGEGFEPQGFMQISSIGNPQGIYDPGRDILAFMPYLFKSVIYAMKTKKIPALETRLMGEPGLAQATARVIEAWLATFKDTQWRYAGYDAFSQEWVSKCKPEDDTAFRLVLEIMGRMVLQFYVAAIKQAYDPSKGLPGTGESLLTETLMDGPGTVATHGA